MRASILAILTMYGLSGSAVVAQQQDILNNPSWVGPEFFDGTTKGTLAIVTEDCSEGSVVGRHIYVVPEPVAVFEKASPCLKIIINTKNKSGETTDPSYMAIQILGLYDTSNVDTVTVIRKGRFFIYNSADNRIYLSDKVIYDATTNTGMHIADFDAYHQLYAPGEDPNDPLSTTPRRRAFERALGSTGLGQFHGVPEGGNKDSWDARVQFRTDNGIVNRSAIAGRSLDYRLYRFSEFSQTIPSSVVGAVFNRSPGLVGVVIKTYSPADPTAYTRIAAIVLSSDPVTVSKLTSIVLAHRSFFDRIFSIFGNG